MDSKLARQAEQELIAANRLRTPEQRLEAFLAHCELMEQLRRAGESARRASEPKQDRSE
jgi:hypothetical protein